MPFVRRANDFINNPNRTLPRWREMQETLRFLLGQTTPVSIETVLNHLAAQSLQIGREPWQQEVLTPLRDDGVFIGSSNQGVFIIRNRTDAINCYRFYTNRIIAESEHLGILSDLIRRAGWGNPQINVS